MSFLSANGVAMGANKDGSSSTLLRFLLSLTSDSEEDMVLVAKEQHTRRKSAELCASSFP